MSLVQQVADFFAPSGALARALPGFESRSVQVEVALHVARCMESGQKLVAEAGTGTGKTLAYLVPALLSGKRVVVSTATKNLQDQIVGKDIPTLARALGRQIDFQVMKGRNNYLCEARAEDTLAQQFLPGSKEREWSKQIVSWRGQTQTGDRVELTQLPDDATLWRDLSATSEQCTGRFCEHYERCWITQMRRRAMSSPLVIVNHHLFFADAALRQQLGEESTAILPAYDVAIFDEAHEIEDIAAQHFGFQVSDKRPHDLGRDILTAAAGEGVLQSRLTPLFADLDKRFRLLFDQLRYSESRVRFAPNDMPQNVREECAEIDVVIKRLEGELSNAQSDAVKMTARRVANLGHELAFVMGLPAMAASLVSENAIAQHETETVPYVRYTERVGRQRVLVARPVDVAEYLKRIVNRPATILMSATLRVAESFGHFNRRLGLAQAEECVVDSPFDYPEQACLYIPPDLPEPEGSDFTELATERIIELVRIAGGGAFVLCTSLRMMQWVSEALQKLREFPVLVQGDAPKEYLIQQFRQHGNAALVATMSFWRGVDVPGHALRMVIIDRLPFSSPSDPLVQARTEYLQARNIDPFMNLQIPQASLLLRQGFGRLIRTRNDFGVVAILDRRLKTRRYGSLLLRGLPKCGRTEDLHEVERFMRLKEKHEKSRVA